MREEPKTAARETLCDQRGKRGITDTQKHITRPGGGECVKEGEGDRERDKGEDVCLSLFDRPVALGGG
jgi:hypothetical protein